MRRKSSKDIIAALDIGTNKICCAIASWDKTVNAFRVLSSSQFETKGIRRGNIVDLEAAENSILNAVNVAEKEAGISLSGVIINISGTHLLSETVEVEVGLDQHPVSDQHISKMISMGTLNERKQKNFEVIHTIPLHYSIDGNKDISDPRGMFGSKLTSLLHVITANPTPLRNLVTCVHRCHLNINAMVSSGFASGLATLVDDEMDIGAVVIDMGAGTTNISVFLRGNLVHTHCFPIGGNHVTNDIVQGLSTPPTHAERLKILYGNCIPTPQEEKQVILVPQIGDGHATHQVQVSRYMLTAIIAPRLEELFEMIANHLDSPELQRIAGRRVVITGGASQLTGVQELSSKILHRQVRMGNPLRLIGLEQDAGGPQFATCAGLLAFALREPEAGATQIQPSGKLSRVMSWIRNNF